MKVSEAINQADGMRPNAVSEVMKRSWLTKLDGEIAELMLKDPDDYPDYSDGDPDLLMPSPHDGIYPLYLIAMIDFANEDSDLYANDYTMANNSISEAKRWYVRNHDRPTQKHIEVM